MEIIEYLKNSTWAWFILSSCTLASVALAIYFGIKSLGGKIIGVMLSSNELIINKQPNLSKFVMLYDNKPIEALTVTKLTFWSKSTETINETDIIDTEPISIIAKNGEIIDVSVLEGDKSSNAVNISPFNDTTAHITFNYLDKNQGGIIQIIHTGNRDSIDITRKIKGGKIKVQKFSPKTHKILCTASIIACVLIILYICGIPFELIYTTLFFIGVFGGAILAEKPPTPYMPTNCYENLPQKNSVKVTPQINEEAQNPELLSATSNDKAEKKVNPTDD